MLSSVLPFVAAVLGALAMALAFPKTNAAILAPIGAIGLFWAWFGVSPKRAFWLGWFAGAIFFYLNFAWFGETAGALIAPFGFLLALGPALIEALLGFGLAGAACAFAARALGSRSRVVRGLVPLAAAAAFTTTEWLRCEGLGELGVPFGSLGYTQANSPTAPVAAFGGTYGLTFLICILGAYAAAAFRGRARRETAADAAGALCAVAAIVVACIAFAPARALPPPTIAVAAIQGNIAQAVKFRPAALAGTLDRYERLTLRAAATHPQLIVWPETVIPVAMNNDPLVATRLGALARRVGATLVVGTLVVAPEGEYNVLFVFDPRGAIETIYRKRRLVPFAEHLPFGRLLRGIPWASNVSDFEAGSSSGLFRAGAVAAGPVICWESDFSGLVREDARAGASELVIATDDAWFGTSAGPFMHAETAQLRALESGRYIVRAASTGISGIIAPNGRYTRASELGQAAVVTGKIGPPVKTPYMALGDGSLALFLGALYLGIVAFGRARA